METSTILILLATTFTTTFAAVAIGPAPVNEVCPGQCWDAGNSKCVPVGESYIPSGGCTKAQCTTYKSKLFVEYLTCGTVALPPGCHIVEDKTLSYPQCCTAMTCDSGMHSLENDVEYKEFTNWLEQEYPGDNSIEI
ncbi:unnamed protein product [Meganyctiphanes norvegica]|uniref:Single domain-containing protein n=1 Tax=Meganyctiphanes norvegica TaxID=48144 RepID=A0AAV2Q2Y7_MEGNR